MKKLFLSFIFFAFLNLYGQSNPMYSIKLGTYKYLKSAKVDKERSKLDTFILKGKKFYGLYTGSFKDKISAKRGLKEIKKIYNSAYITDISSNKNAPKLLKDEYVEIVKMPKEKPKPTKEKPKIKKKNIKKIETKKEKTIKKDYLMIAKTFFQTGDYESALAAYDHILIDEPDNHLARLEYARTLYNLGFYKSAKKEFTTVLNTNPPSTVQKNIKAYIKKIDSFSKEHIFYGSVGIGLTYDDNLGFNTDKKTTQYGDLILQNDTNITKGFYHTLSFVINHIYKTDRYSWSNTLYSYNEFQNEDIENLYFLNFTTAISKKYYGLNLSLPLTFNQVWLNSRSYSFIWGFIPTIDYQLDNSTNYQVSIKYQDTKITDDKNKDYKTYGTKISFVKLFNKITLYTSGALERDERETKVRYDISKERLMLSTRLYYSLLEDGIFGLGYRYSFDHYSHMDNTLGYKRKDKKNIFSASIKQKLSKAIFAILNFQRITNNSNINSYCYEKDSYSFHYQYKF